jgi:hypothetical protein
LKYNGNEGGAGKNHIRPQKVLPRSSCTSSPHLLFPSTVLTEKEAASWRD